MSVSKHPSRSDSITSPLIWPIFISYRWGPLADEITDWLRVALHQEMIEARSGQTAKLDVYLDRRRTVQWDFDKDLIPYLEHSRALIFVLDGSASSRVQRNSTGANVEDFLYRELDWWRKHRGRRAAPIILETDRESGKLFVQQTDFAIWTKVNRLPCYWEEWKQQGTSHLDKKKAALVQDLIANIRDYGIRIELDEVKRLRRRFRAALIAMFVAAAAAVFAWDQFKTAAANERQAQEEARTAQKQLRIFAESAGPELARHGQFGPLVEIVNTIKDYRERIKFEQPRKANAIISRFFRYVGKLFQDTLFRNRTTLETEDGVLAAASARVLNGYVRYVEALSMQGEGQIANRNVKLKEAYDLMKEAEPLYAQLRRSGRSTTELATEEAAFWTQMSNVKRDLGETEPALQMLRKTIELRKEFASLTASAGFGLAGARTNSVRLGEALQSSAKLKMVLTQGHSNAGKLDPSLLSEAKLDFEQAVTIATKLTSSIPNDATLNTMLLESKNNLINCVLLQRDFPEVQRLCTSTFGTIGDDDNRVTDWMSSEGYQRYFDQQKTSQFLLKVEGKNASRGGDEFRSIWQALDEESSSFWRSYHNLTANALLATDEDAARRGFIRKWLNCHKNTQGEWMFCGIWYDRQPHPKTQPTLALSADSIRTHAQQLLYDTQYNTAIEEFKKVLALEPNDAESYSGIADCFYYLDDASSALQAIDAALSIDPKTSKFWEIKGNILDDKGDEDSARDHWRHAVDVDPKNASAWTSLGDSWLGRGQIDPATGAFQHAIDADPDDVQRHTKLVLCFLLSNNIASAKQALRPAFKVFPNDPQLKAIDTVMTAIENGADASNPEQLKQVLETLKVTLLQKER